jgi:hypothetical protein
MTTLREPVDGTAYPDRKDPQPTEPCHAKPPSTGFKFPPTLEPKHIEAFNKRGISKEFALASGVRTAADNELRELNFQASLPVDERKKGLFGIVFPYRDLETGQECAWRLRPDVPFIMGDGGKAKYLSRLGDKVRAYFPHTTTSQQAANPKVNVIITEGEFKALAIAEKIVPIASRPTCVIGLQGINGGWHRDKTTIILPDGTKETRKEGAPHLIDDLVAWEWKKRVVYLTSDSDVATKKHAAEFKQNKRTGAWGAEYTLAQLLRLQGAEVRIVVLPPRLDGTKYGADDYIAERGAHDFLRLIYNNWVVERDPDEVLYTEKRAAIQIKPARELVLTAPARPAQVIAKILPVGGVAIIGGASGVGKSFIAINACQAVATGEKVLDYLETEKGKSLYIQTELAGWTLAERIKGLGPISDNFLIWSPGSELPLNFWEPDGFNKRRETGARETVMALLDQIKSYSPRLVCFDPLMDFTSVSLRDQEAAGHVMQVFRMIARAAQCGVLLIHHHKKTGGRESRYEGQDDSFGSYAIAAKVDSGINLYSYPRSDGTCRYKMVFSKLRHSAPMSPMEIDRMSGGNSLAWRAFPWDDNTRTKVTDDDRLIEALEGGRIEYKEALKRSGLTKSTFYRVYDRLEKKGILRREGNVYFLASSDEENGNY